MKLKFLNRYWIFSVVLVIVYVGGGLARFNPIDLDLNNPLYPLYVSYTLIPLVFLYVVYKAITFNRSKSKFEQLEDDFEQSYGNVRLNPFSAEDKSKEFEKLLFLFEKRLYFEISRLRNTIRKKELAGRVFVSVAFIIPVFTWLYSFQYATNPTSFPNFKNLTWTSFTAGTVLLTSGLALLNSARKNTQEVEKNNSELQRTQKFRLITLSTDLEDKKSEYLDKIIDALLKENKQEEKEKEEEMKVSSIIQALAKSIKS